MIDLIVLRYCCSYEGTRALYIHDTVTRIIIVQ